MVKILGVLILLGFGIFFFSAWADETVQETPKGRIHQTAEQISVKPTTMDSDSQEKSLLDNLERRIVTLKGEERSQSEKLSQIQRKIYDLKSRG